MLPEVDGLVIFSPETLVNATLAVELAPTVEPERTRTWRALGSVITAELSVPLIVTVLAVMDAGIVVPVGNWKKIVSPMASPPVPVVNEIV